MQRNLSASNRKKLYFCDNFELTIDFSIVKTNVTNKKPSECQNITDVRNEIDNIDNMIISLLSERFEYVKEVVKYKEKTADGIVAADRKKAVLERRRQLAKEKGLDPDVIGDIYEKLINYFISEEMKIMNL